MCFCSRNWFRLWFQWLVAPSWPFPPLGRNHSALSPQSSENGEVKSPQTTPSPVILLICSPRCPSEKKSKKNPTVFWCMSILEVQTSPLNPQPLCFWQYHRITLIFFFLSSLHSDLLTYQAVQYLWISCMVHFLYWEIIYPNVKPLWMQSGIIHLLSAVRSHSFFDSLHQKLKLVYFLKSSRSFMSLVKIWIYFIFSHQHLL